MSFVEEQSGSQEFLSSLVILFVCVSKVGMIYDVYF